MNRIWPNIVWQLYRLWRHAGIRFFKLPMVLEYNAAGRIIGITFSASLEHAQALKDFWERREYYHGLAHELEVAHDQIAQLEGKIKPPAKGKAK